jgi:hypothetical protein
MKNVPAALRVLIAIFGCVTALAQAPRPCSPGVACAQTAAGPGEKPLCSAGPGEIRCKEDGTGYVYTFTVTNNTGDVVTSVLVTPPLGATYTITPQQPPIPGGSLPNGQSATLQVTISGGQAGDKICFAVTQMTAKKTCCTVDLCVVLPNCCATINQLKLSCLKNGTYSYTFTVTNNTPNTIQHVYLYPPTGVTMTPTYFAVNLLPHATSQPLTVTISGASPGRFCFDISIHTPEMKNCCTFTQCVELPPCGEASACAPGVCCARAPVYAHTSFTGQKVAVVTGYRNDPNVPQNNVLTVFDISGANGFPQNANSAPPQYNGPAGNEWTLANLGSIFGVTLDHLGNIYVTASPVYTRPPGAPAAPHYDYYPGGPGRVFKILNNSGMIDTSFAPMLPNTPDPNISGQDAYPSLGNISFDCRRKQFFVTDLDDGRIYRIDATGAVQSTYDHATNTVAAGGSPEPGDAPGFAPLGERVFAVKVHNDRVYYSVVGQDCANRNTGFKNQIWSIGLTLLNDFDASDRRLELTIPDLAGETFSNPTTDISFGWDGRMLLSERTLGCSSDASCNTPAYAGTTSNAHASRVLEYICDAAGAWKLAPAVTGFPYRYNVGGSAAWYCPVATAARPANAAGGNDYDYDTGAQYRVWATGDYLKSGPLIYGLQGFPLAGGTSATSPLIGLYGTGSFKTQIGDVAISCPPGGSGY